MSNRETATRGRRPFKVWDSGRSSRKALVVSSLEELIVRGREKLSIGVENVRAVLEADGTQVDDSEFFRTLPDNTVFLLLRNGEKWAPAGVDVIRAALSSIPKIVCEAISCLDLQDEVPSWKIMESRGRITIVLTWDQRDPLLRGTPDIKPEPGMGPPRPVRQPRFLHHDVRTVVNKDGKMETFINDFGHHGSTVSSGTGLSTAATTPTITVHHDDDLKRGAYCRYDYPAGSSRGLPRQGSSSIESSATATAVHVHTMECSQRGVFESGATAGRAHSPPGSHCDFHCCALHEEGRKIQVHKAVATSPIDPSMFDTHHQQARGGPYHPQQPLLKPTHHVRFKDNGGNGTNGKKRPHQHVGTGGGGGAPPPLPPHAIKIDVPMITSSSSEESETENQSTLERRFSKMLQLSTTDDSSAQVGSGGSSAHKYSKLSIKDIGIILERLSNKIIDVEYLSREYHKDLIIWNLRATVVGECNCGVVYNGKYYSINESDRNAESDFDMMDLPPPPAEDTFVEEDMRL